MNYSAGGGGAVIPYMQSPPFSAADFTGGLSMTWTVAAGHVRSMRYRVTNGVMEFYWYIANGVVGGTLSTDLRIKIPGGYLAKYDMNFITEGQPFGLGWEYQSSYVVAAGNLVVINRSPTAPNWTAGACQVSGQCSFEVQ